MTSKNNIPQFIFVTGTGTNVGKTYISAFAAKSLHASKKNIAYWKPIQTGIGKENQHESDTHFVKTFCKGLANVSIFEPYITLAPPLSPDQASTESILLEQLWFMREKLANFDTVIIEGAGGIFVPLNSQGETWLDFIEQWQCKTIVVSHSQLGTLNHTMLTVEALAHLSKNKIKAIVFSGERNAANEKSLQHLLIKRKLSHIPFFAIDDIHNAVLQNEFSSVLSVESSPENIRDIDQKHIWHPYTQHQTEAMPIFVTRAKDEFYFTDDQTKLLDASASWWTNTIGHGDIRISRALSRQQQNLDHCLFAGFTHKPAATLAKKLVEITHPSLSRVFYSDNGSTAVEVALKMAYQFFHNQKQDHKKTFLALRGSYHGDTFGTMSIGGAEDFHKTFKKFLFHSDFIDPCLDHASIYFAKEQISQATEEFRSILKEKSHTIAALIVEPLVQGAGGMLMHNLLWLKTVCELARENNILVIFDEVFTGFARTGSHFAFEQLGFIPDILCLSKAITGGALPLGATLASAKIFSSFLGSEKSQALLHGHSYTGNPIICEVASTAIDIMLEEKLAEKAQLLAQVSKLFADKWVNEGKIFHSRIKGGIFAFETQQESLPGGGYFSSHSQNLVNKFRDAGIWVRPLGGTIYLLPPLTVNLGRYEKLLNSL